MVKRRAFVDALWRVVAAAALGTVSSARAQRAMNPIARPPGVRPGGRGRFDQQGGVALRAWPGTYVVVGVDTGADTLQLRDADGRVAAVHVSEQVFDLATLKPGDEVEVDFLVPDAGSSRIEAGGVWKVQR